MVALDVGTALKQHHFHHCVATYRLYKRPTTFDPTSFPSAVLEAGPLSTHPLHFTRMVAGSIYTTNDFAAKMGIIEMLEMLTQKCYLKALKGQLGKAVLDLL